MLRWAWKLAQVLYKVNHKKDNSLLEALTRSVRGKVINWMLGELRHLKLISKLKSKASFSCADLISLYSISLNNPIKTCGGDSGKEGSAM